MRLDIYLVENKLAKSRDRAKFLIKNSSVTVNDKVITKPSHNLLSDDTVKLLQADHKYVSRGAFKLKAILDNLKHNFRNKYVIDIGSSTGGFSQVSIEYGAEHVIAVDVGTNQLDESLRNLNNITLFEQTDARKIRADKLPYKIDTLVSDVSFISQKNILPYILNELKSIKNAYILVKPQFELTKDKISKGGIVRSKKDRQQALNSVIECLKENNFKVIHSMDSPITGGDGNHEYILYATRINF